MLNKYISKINIKSHLIVTYKGFNIWHISLFIIEFGRISKVNALQYALIKIFKPKTSLKSTNDALKYLRLLLA